MYVDGPRRREKNNDEYGDIIYVCERMYIANRARESGQKAFNIENVG